MLQKILKSSILIGMVCIYTLQSGFVYAQIIPNTGTQFNDVSVTLSPEYPKPGEIVRASLVSYSQELQGIDITWSYGNEIIDQGQGKVTTELIAPNIGEQRELIIRVGDVAQVSTLLSPIYIDLLWEANTHVPQWYKGRALPVDSSHIKALAIPHGLNKDASTLLYNWYIDGRFIQQASGAGKSTATVNAPRLFDDYNLSVQVLDKQGHKLGESGVHIYTVEPEVVLYSVAPLLGVLMHAAFGSGASIGLESALTALPFYFTIPSPQSLTYEWDIGQDSFAQPSKNTIIITGNGAQGSISVAAHNPQTLLQSARATQQLQKVFESNGNQQHNDGTINNSPFGNPNQ